MRSKLKHPSITAEVAYLKLTLTDRRGKVYTKCLGDVILPALKSHHELLLTEKTCKPVFSPASAEGKADTLVRFPHLDPKKEESWRFLMLRCALLLDAATLQWLLYLFSRFLAGSKDA
eukprot:g18645.t1